MSYVEKMLSGVGVVGFVLIMAKMAHAAQVAIANGAHHWADNIMAYAAWSN